MAECGICLLTCDESHIPNGALLAFNPHHRQLQQMRYQLDWTEPFKKRCWQELIRQKIANQKSNLQTIGDTDNAERLEILRQSVQSGDVDNREAVAARIYWRAYFGAQFKRQSEHWHSSALNYGYAVIRSAIAKHLTAAGFLPAIGLHHRSQLNGWNLADDLLEPFRPIVDRYVYQLPAESGAKELTIQDRQRLAALLTHDCYVDEQRVNMLLATELMVQALVGISRVKNVKIFKVLKAV